jgi:nitrogen regulatory protein P-II 1
MKKLEVIIKPNKLDAVRKAIKESGYPGMTISQVEGHGTQKGLTQERPAGKYRMELLPKMKLEIIIADRDLEPIAAAVMVAARTGQAGDGKIFVSDIQDVIRIRTGERGEKAI